MAADSHSSEESDRVEQFIADCFGYIGRTDETADGAIKMLDAAKASLAEARKNMPSGESGMFTGRVEVGSAELQVTAALGKLAELKMLQQEFIEWIQENSPWSPTAGAPAPPAGATAPASDAPGGSTGANH